MAKSCTYNGRTYSDGSTVCQSGETHRCDDGSWSNLHFSCTAADGDLVAVVTPPLEVFRSSAVGSAEVVHVSDRTVIASPPAATATLVDCTRFYSTGAGNTVGIRNNCGECKKCVVNWDGKGVYKYRVNAYSQIEVQRESGRGEIIGEEPC